MNLIMSEKKMKILLSGGGTGGHIYPALAVAAEFKKQLPGCDIRFVGSERGLENKIIPEKNYKLYALKIGPLHSSVGRLQQIKTLILLPWVVIQCLWILITFRPHRVVGFGGYASGPIVLMASLLFIPTAIWEANVQPGIANRVLAFFVKYCFVVFEESLKYFPTNKTRSMGYPVRAEFDGLYASKKVISHISQKDLSAQVEANKAMMAEEHVPELSSKRLRVLVFGGSQGAKIFNSIIPVVAPKFPNIDFTLQTGIKNYEQVLKKIDSSAGNLKIYPFLDPIIDFYLSADLIICRSGAGAVAELAAIGAKCLFVPFAYASDNHQYKNAMALSDKQAAFLIQEKNFNEQSLGQFLNDFKAKSEASQRQMSQRMLAFFKPEATKNIVSQLVGR